MYCPKLKLEPKFRDKKITHKNGRDGNISGEVTNAMSIFSAPEIKEFLEKKEFNLVSSKKNFEFITINQENIKISFTKIERAHHIKWLAEKKSLRGCSGKGVCKIN